MGHVQVVVETMPGIRIPSSPYLVSLFLASFFGGRISFKMSSFSLLFIIATPFKFPTFSRVSVCSYLITYTSISIN